MQLFKKIIVSLLLLGCMVSAAPFTIAGTIIQSETITISYTGGFVTDNPLVELKVATINGFELIPNTGQTITPDEVAAVYFPHKIINNGNVTDNVSWNILYIDSNWDYEYIQDDNNDGVWQSGEVTVINSPVTLAAQASINFFLKFDPIYADYINSGLEFEMIAPENTVSYNGFNLVKYGGDDSNDVSDNIDATNIIRAGLDVTAYLEGYYDYESGTQQPVTVNIQFRVTQDIDAGISFNVSLDNIGHASFLRTDIPTGDFYICVRQYIEDLPLGVNHVAYVSSENITLLQNQLTTINISDSVTDPASYLEPYVSQVTGLSPMTEIHGMFQLKGADSNADQKVNVVDIVAWENQAKDSNADENSDAGWTEKANYNGDALINGQDFSVWSKNKGQYIPLPEDDQ